MHSFGYLWAPSLRSCLHLNGRTQTLKVNRQYCWRLLRMPLPFSCTMISHSSLLMTFTSLSKRTPWKKYLYSLVGQRWHFPKESLHILALWDGFGFELSPGQRNLLSGRWEAIARVAMPPSANSSGDSQEMASFCKIGVPNFVVVAKPWWAGQRRPRKQ